MKNSPSRTLVFDDGGGTTREVDLMENVYGFPEGVTGPELVERGREQAGRFGTEFVHEEVVRIGHDDGGTDLAEMLGVQTDGGDVVTDEGMGTNVPSVYAAGDVTGGQRQINTSVGEGTRAAINLLEELRDTDGYVDYRKLASEPAAGD